MAALNNDSLNMAGAAIAYDATLLPSHNGGLVSTVLGGVSAWAVVLTVLLGLVLYDQGKSAERNGELPHTTMSF